MHANAQRRQRRLIHRHRILTRNVRTLSQTACQCQHTVRHGNTNVTRRPKVTVSATHSRRNTNTKITRVLHNVLNTRRITQASGKGLSNINRLVSSQPVNLTHVRLHNATAVCHRHDNPYPLRRLNGHHNVTIFNMGTLTSFCNRKRIHHTCHHLSGLLNRLEHTRGYQTLTLNGSLTDQTNRISISRQRTVTGALLGNNSNTHGLVKLKAGRLCTSLLLLINQ